jgi:hypothetical protein
VLERHGGGAFIAPQENLAIGVSETSLEIGLRIRYVRSET